MKIRMNFGILGIVIISVVIAGALAIIGLDIAIFSGAAGIYVNSFAIPGVSIATAAIVLIAAILILANSNYHFKDTHFVITLGFFADKIAYDDVILAKQDIESKELYLIVKGKKSDMEQLGLKVVISPAKADAFIAEMRKHIPSIEVDLFSSPKKKKKDK